MTFSLQIIWKPLFFYIFSWLEGVAWKNEVLDIAPLFFSKLWTVLNFNVISLRSYVNEQWENVKKSQYDSKQSAKCNHCARTDGFNTYVKKIDLKQKLLSCFQKTFLRGTMKWNKYCLIKKTLLLRLAEDSFKANERFGNQKVGKNLVL